MDLAVALEIAPAPLDQITAWVVPFDPETGATGYRREVSDLSRLGVGGRVWVASARERLLLIARLARARRTGPEDGRDLWSVLKGLELRELRPLARRAGMALGSIPEAGEARAAWIAEGAVELLRRQATSGS